MRFSRQNRLYSQTRLKWWQIRTIDFSLFLTALIVQRVLVLALWVIAATYTDLSNGSMSHALDATYLGVHAPTTLAIIIISSWILLFIAMLTAYFERPYGLEKSILIFGGLLTFMWTMTSNTLTLYAPFLELR